MRIIKTAFLVSFFFIAFSCSKSDSDSAATPKTPTQLLAGTSSKSWKISAATVLGLDFLTNAVFADYNKACIVDNLLVFKTDYTYQITEGTTKCTATATDLILTDNWTISADGKTLHINQFTFAGKTISNVDFTITSLTETSIQANTSVTLLGTLAPVNITFTAS